MTTDDLADELLAQARQAEDRGDYTTAQHHYEEALACYEKMPALRGQPVSRCWQGLGKIASQRGDYTTARSWLDKALEIRPRFFGSPSPEVAETLQALGEMLFDQGEFDAGIEKINQALEMRLETLGPDDPATIESELILALMQGYLTKSQQALPLLQELLERCTRRWGEEHPITARVYNALGLTWMRQPETRELARQAYTRALEITQKLKGPDHPDTARSLNNLATAFADLKQDDVAIPILERSLTLHERIFGHHSPMTALTLSNLGDCYKHTHRLIEARRLYTRALIIREKIWGARHPETIRALRKLVSLLGTLSQQGDPAVMTEAMPLHQSLTALEAAADPEQDQSFNWMPGAHQDPEKAAAELHRLLVRLEEQLNQPPRSAAELAALKEADDLIEQAREADADGFFEEAHDYLTRALALQEQVLGPADLELVPLLKLLADIEKKRGHPSAVLPLYQRIADIHISRLGASHIQSLQAQSELFLLYHQEYGPAAALPLQERLAQATVEALGPDAPQSKMMLELFERSKEMAAREPEIREQSRSAQREAALAAPLPPERAALLDGLDAIDWHAVHHAYGPADDVPAQLRLLLSDDPEIREMGWQELFGSVIHQGTIYEATACVVPFMLRMLAQTGDPQKELELLDFLILAAEGTGYLIVHAREEKDQEIWRGILAKDGRTLETAIQREIAIKADLHHALEAGIDLYFKLLESDDPENRHMVLYLLAALTGRAGEIAPPLRSRLEKTAAPEMQIALIRALDNLLDDGPESCRFFAGWISGPNPGAGFFAAAALLQRTRTAAPDFAVQSLTRRMIDLRKEPSYDEHLNYYDNRPTTFMTGLRAFSKLDEARAVTALLEILPALDDPDQSLELAEILLDIVFNDGRIQPQSTARGRDDDGKYHVNYGKPQSPALRDLAMLTNLQRSVLKALIHHNPFWKYRHDLLKIYGLPISREELKREL